MWYAYVTVGVSNTADGDLRAILRDESTFPDAFEFRPERFITEKDPHVLAKMEPRNYVFGFGRRRCPGADLVESSIWLLLVTMMATLDISKAIDANGLVIEPNVEYGNNAKFRFAISGFGVLYYRLTTALLQDTL